MSQGYIGYHLQQAIDEELVARNLGEQPVVTLITQVVVQETARHLLEIDSFPQKLSEFCQLVARCHEQSPLDGQFA
jgi:hypothetical protein